MNYQVAYIDNTALSTVAVYDRDTESSSITSSQQEQGGVIDRLQGASAGTTIVVIFIVSLLLSYFIQSFKFFKPSVRLHS